MLTEIISNGKDGRLAGIEFFGYSSPGIIIDNSTRVYITV